jgi:hypothetical protein
MHPELREPPNHTLPQQKEAKKKVMWHPVCAAGRMAWLLSEGHMVEKASF